MPGELLTMLLEPETLYSYTHLRWAVPPRKSILGRGYLQSTNTQQMVALWLRYGRPPFNPPRYAAVSQAIEATFQAVVVSKQQVPGDGVQKLVHAAREDRAGHHTALHRHDPSGERPAAKTLRPTRSWLS